MRVLRLLLPLLLCCACVGPRPAPGPQPPPPQLDSAAGLIEQKQFAAADAQLAPLLAAGEFRRLDGVAQHRALQLSAMAALGVHDLPRARALARRACALPQTEARDWYLRIIGDVASDDLQDAARALTVLATRWPKRLPALYASDIALEAAVDALNEFGSDEDRYTVLSALFTDQFSAEPDADASSWWRDLALLQLARGERAAALKTLARVTDPYVVVSVEADQRFAPLREPLATELNVADVATFSIAFFAQQAHARGNLLEPRVQLASHLNDSLRYQEALQVSELAIERGDEQGHGAYSDYEQQYPWIQNLRADALYSLGRWDAALEQLQSAAGTPPHQHAAQLINLANVYADLGRPQEALATLQRLPAQGLSTRGNMEAQLVRCDAAVQLHDAAALEHALAYLRAHRAEWLPAYQEALLIAGRDAEGAQLLIERLNGARTRSAALIAVQDYGAEALPPRALQERSQWAALRARADVQQAIGRVGTVRSYPLAGGNF